MKCDKQMTFLMDFLYITTQLDFYEILFTCNPNQ